MGKPTICIGENFKLLVCLYRPVCVGPVRKPHCLFSREAAHLVVFNFFCAGGAISM